MAAREAPNEERSEIWKALVAGVLVAGLIGLVAWQFVGDPPPDRLRLATGGEGGGYDRAGVAIRDQLAEDGIVVELVRSEGTAENLELLQSGEVDVAFAQGGVLEDSSGLVGVASLYFEPLWVFARADAGIDELADLAGKRLQIGADGSGTAAVARAMLGLLGIDASSAQFLQDHLTAARQQLESGDCDAMFVVVRPDAEVVHELFATSGLVAVSVDRAIAFSRRLRELEPLVLTPGMIDLQRNLPDRDVPLVAPAATLLARAELHESVFPLLIRAARRQFGQGGLFEDEGEFPNGRNLDAPLSEASERYFAQGLSFLYRVFPFQLAAALDRLKIMLLPLLTLLLPLMRIMPPAYRWRIRSRIYKWYGEVMRIEAMVRAQDDSAGYAVALSRLDEVERDINTVKVPLSYAEELYNLRMHMRLVRDALESRRDAATG